MKSFYPRMAKLNIANPSGTAPGAQTIVYDANGNRTSFGAYGTTDTYTTNNLNQYTARNATPASYDANGNMITGLDGSSYTYDAQNRLSSASRSGTTVTFKYDALNRQVSRTINGARYDSIWDGWNLIVNYDSTNAWTNAYWHGPGGMLAEWEAGTRLCYSDASGSTTHLADKTTGQLLEWYRYDLDGTPLIYDANNAQRSASAYNIRHLFTGQQWYRELGLYDLRYRFYLPDTGRFLQPDPFDFSGDPTNLYRYCKNNPVVYSDPSGAIPVIGTVFGAVTGGVGGAMSGYYQGGWSGAALGLLTGGIVGGFIGTWFEPGAPTAGSIVASAVVGAAESCIGQVLGNASGHVVQGQSPQWSDFKNVNPGMIVGGGVGGAASPLIKVGGAALLGTGYFGKTATSAFEGIVAGRL